VDQTQLISDETVNYNIINYLLTSNVAIDSQLDVAANGREATLRTTGWNFRPSTWYLYFRQVDFPANPDINMQWEWQEYTSGKNSDRRAPRGAPGGHGRGRNRCVHELV